MRQMMVVAGTMLAMVALAMPSKQDLVDVQPLMQELMRKDISAMNAGTKTPTQVADASVALVPSAETEAAKFVLLRGAVTLYARDGQYDKAADALDMLLATVKDVPPETVEGIVSAAARNTATAKAPRLFAQYRAAKRKIQAAKELPALQARVKREPKNLSLRQSLAECLANMGEWKDALNEFAKLDDEFAQAARFELDESSVKGYNALRAADFWWGYTAVDIEPFRIHAAELYRKAMSAGQVTGLRRKVVQNRLDEMAPTKAAPARKPEPPPARKSIAAAASASGWALPATFTPPLEKTLTLPSGEKVTFVACPAGTFQMSNYKKDGSTHKVTITRPFWISKTPVTARQRKGFIEKEDQEKADKIAAAFPDKEVVLMRRPCYAQDRSDNDSYCRVLNRQLAAQLPPGYVFRPPTEAELEYAWTAGGRAEEEGPSLTESSMSALKAKGFLPANAGPAEFYGNGICLLPRQLEDNAWGLGMNCRGGRFQTLDKIVSGQGHWEDDIKPEEFPYAAEETDPLRRCEGSDWSYVGRMGMKNRWMFRLRLRKCMFHLVIGPDLLGAAPAANPPVAGGNTGTTGVSPVAATGFKASGDTPKPLSLDLGGGVKMEMVGCPAGQFYMGDKKDPGQSAFAKGHMVELTRSFWIGKFPVTIEQWERLAGRRDPPPGVKRRDMDGKLPVQSCPEVPLTRADMEDFMARLTRKFKGKLPQGYVFRLPTNAEWEYALLAGMDATSARDALRASVVTMEDSKAYWQPRGLDVSALGEQHWDSKKWNAFPENFPYVPVGARPANAWGICDMVGVGGELVLDSWRWQKTGGWGAVVEKNAAVWADGVKDPLLFEADSEVCLVRGNYKQQEPHGRWHTCLYGYSLAGKKYRRIYRLRVVAGPDLMKERGITPPAQGK